MKKNLHIPLLLLLLYTTSCSHSIVNKSFSIYAGKSVQTLPANDSCFTKHIDILHFTRDSQQLYYRTVYICRTNNQKTKKVETRLAETLPYTLDGNKIITPTAVYDTLELKGWRLRTKYGDFLKRLRVLK